MKQKYFFKRLNSLEKKEDPLPAFLHAYVHPCVINDQPHIVYSRGLQQKSPGLFTKLTKYYQQQGYILKEDQRSEDFANKYKNERRKWAPILLFTASLIFESSAFADVEFKVNHETSSQQHHHQIHQQIQVQLISNKDIRKQIQSKIKQTDQIKQTQIKSELARSIFEILSSRYKKQNSDPEYIVDDLKEIANYYSDFLESVTLIQELKNKNWTLIFDENNWITTGSGNMLQVDNAVIHFNTRSAAQLRLNNGCVDNPVCIASPADALLHELLHTHSMLVKGEEFVAQGGMNNVMYPYKHEYIVIDAERELYASMSTQDNIKRPQRREHTGRIVKAHCPTCIK